MTDISDDLFAALTNNSFKDKSKIVRDVSEVNNNQGVELYIAVGHLEFFLEFIGCPDLESLPNLANHFNTFHTTNPILVIHAVPLNPEALPYELEDKTKHIWVMMDDFGLAECPSINSVVKTIETLIRKWPNTRIEEFS
jgi:hypothetical protein